MDSGYRPLHNGIILLSNLQNISIMKKYYLVIIFIFTSGFLMAQFTKTITEKDGSTRTITKTTDQSLTEVYSEEVRNKNGKLTSKKIYKKDLRNRWEVEHYETRIAKGQTEYRLSRVQYFNEKGEITRSQDYAYGKPGLDERRNSEGGLEVVPKPTFKFDDEFEDPIIVEYMEYSNGLTFEWLDKLDEKSPPPPQPNYKQLLKEKREQLFERKNKKSKDTKVSFYIGPSFLNGDNGSSRESFFGGQVYGLFNVNSNIAIGPDFSLNSKKDGDHKFTRSLVLARGQYAFTGDSFDKGVIPVAHILLGLGSESFKYTSDGNTSKSSGSGLAYGVGAGVGINLCPNIDLGISLDYISVKYENTNNANSNIRASAGIKIGI